MTKELTEETKNELKSQVKQINSIIFCSSLGDYTNGISDGAHTFGDLYYQRMMLTAVIVKAIEATSTGYDDFASKVFRSDKHADGTMFEDYFIVGFNTPEGTFTYHYHNDHILRFLSVPLVDHAPEWDGHTDVDVTRLLSLFNVGGGDAQ